MFVKGCVVPKYERESDASYKARFRSLYRGRMHDYGVSDVEALVKVGQECIGSKALLKHIRGERITMRQAIDAKCFDCCGGYADGRRDCGIPGCSLYPWMRYGRMRSKRVEKGEV